MAQPDLTHDTLFLACTRPAMWHGVPLEALAINAMVTAIVFVMMSNPFYMLAGVVIHHAMRVMIGRDYNLFMTLALWSRTKARARNKEYWGGSSVSPLPSRPPSGSNDVRIHV